MIHYIRGRIDGRIDGGIVIESGGIGYEIYVPDNSPLYLSRGDEPVKVLTAMLVKEDDIRLYGFSEKESLALFRRLLTVNGVGAKGALALLSAMPLNDLKRAIAYDDAQTLTKANGIGKKTAQRICLDLKDKLGDISDAAGGGLSSIGCRRKGAGRGCPDRFGVFPQRGGGSPGKNGGRLKQRAIHKAGAEEPLLSGMFFLKGNEYEL